MLGEAPAPQLKAASLDAVFSGKRNKNIALASGLLLIGLLGISLLGQQFLPSLIPMQAQIPVPNLQVSDLLQAPPKQPLIEGNEQDDFLTSFSLPKPSAYISECLKGFADISVALPGWQLNKIICGSSFTEAQWERQIGSLSLIKPFLDRFPQGTVRSFVDNKSFKATRRLKGERTLSPPAALMNETAATMLLTERFALMGDLKLQTVTPAASQDLLTAVDEMQQARFGASRPDLRPLGRDDLPFIAITLKSTTPPNILLRYFDIAGTMLNMIEGDLGEGMWQYNAKLILKPDKRLVEANKKAKAMQMK